MERIRPYLTARTKPFDPLALVLSLVGLGAVIAAVGKVQSITNLYDPRSMLIVVVGTLVTGLFQYDLATFGRSLVVVLTSFRPVPHGSLRRTLEELDTAIVGQARLDSLREGDGLNGELLNDIVFMHNQGLFYEEISEFVEARLGASLFDRHTAQTMLKRMALIAPSLGLFGTVVGLVGVLNSMDTPSTLGPSMAMAIMTTAYGAGLGSLVLNPLAGRLEHHNEIYAEVHHRLLSKVSLLINRDDRQLESLHQTMEGQP